MAKKPFNYVPNFCKCGKEARVCQWTDTLQPNATWIECECGMITRSFHHKDPLVAKQKAIKMWNAKAKTRKLDKKTGLKSCEKCGSTEVEVDKAVFVTFTSYSVGCKNCGLMTDSDTHFGESLPEEAAIKLWNS
jgi:hypothetical protein